MSDPADILDYWIGDAATDPEAANARVKLWYQSSEAQDEALRSQFGDDLRLAETGELDSWKSQPGSALALVILLDQFSRNLYRGSAKAFSNDPAAQAITAHALQHKFDAAYSIIGTVFLLHPYHHAEDLTRHDVCVERYEQLRENSDHAWHKLLDNFLYHAREHRDVIKRFGRFPHRNEVLARDSTPEEIDYLANGAKRYGQ